VSGGVYTWGGYKMVISTSTKMGKLLIIVSGVGKVAGILDPEELGCGSFDCNSNGRIDEIFMPYLSDLYGNTCEAPF